MEGDTRLCNLQGYFVEFELCKHGRLCKTQDKSFFAERTAFEVNHQQIFFRMHDTLLLSVCLYVCVFTPWYLKNQDGVL